MWKFIAKLLGLIGAARHKHVWIDNRCECGCTRYAGMSHDWVRYPDGQERPLTPGEKWDNV